ncbi:glycosyltransferase family 2 protein [Streptosporangium sp. NPDC004379]|uniref:glycosyltransferase family 2 protein n=1 Tax=Streptosporangium sp. NPDC004379 TaxID=3366189 RepID=UPI0036B2F640
MITVVVPTVGRPSLAATLAAIDPGPDVIVVDDRPEHVPDPRTDLADAVMCELPGLIEAYPAETYPAEARPPGGDGEAGQRIRVVRSGGRGRAAARNAGWRAADTPWVVFLDDDVIPAPGWVRALHADLADLPADVAGSRGRAEPPSEAVRPDGVRRGAAGRPAGEGRAAGEPADAGWATADMAYRRDVLKRVGGFDERFSGAFRQDADLALRVTAAGHRLVRGERVARHPSRDDGPWASVLRQRGNADDALMRRLHGASWRTAVGGGPGRLPRHALTTGLGALGLLAGGLAGSVAARGGPRAAGALRGTAALAGAGWLALTAESAWAHIAPGPRTRQDIRQTLLTSMLIPPAACAHRLLGEWRARR